MSNKVYWSITSTFLIREGEKVALIPICDAFRDLVPFVQFKKREKYP